MSLQGREGMLKICCSSFMPARLPNMTVPLKKKSKVIAVVWVQEK